VKRSGGTGIRDQSDRGSVSLETAIAWIDAATRCLPMERVSLCNARGRVLSENSRAGSALPPRDRAALDGFAVRAQESVGASAYNPLSLPARTVAAGDALPSEADAVVPFEHAQSDETGRIVLVEAVAPGANIERQGAIAEVGAVLVPSGTRLTARHIGMLATAMISKVPVVRQPRVCILLLAGPIRSQRLCDSDGPMIRAAAERDGGVIVDLVAVERNQSALAAALAATDADIVLVIGGTGRGADDCATAALAEAGELAVHGVALRPGETTGLGRTDRGVPVVLLPGAPIACLWSYEMFAGRAIRRLGGHASALPFHPRAMTLTRKIVSAIGMTEIWPVRYGGAVDLVEPMPAFAEIGLMAAVGGDGFIIIPETSEGYPQGAMVTVYPYEGR
jgi:molybdopterin molybdotransferase